MRRLQTNVCRLQTRLGNVEGWYKLWISKAASRHNCSSKLGKFCSRFAFAFTAKIVSICVDDVGTNHPIFSFFDSPCLRYRVLHNGSFCQFIGKPMAVTSTEGYVARRLFNLVLNASPLPIESSQYAIQQVMAYSLLPSMPVAFIQAPLMVAPI